MNLGAHYSMNFARSQVGPDYHAKLRQSGMIRGSANGSYDTPANRYHRNGGLNSSTPVVGRPNGFYQSQLNQIIGTSDNRSYNNGLQPQVGNDSYFARANGLYAPSSYNPLSLEGSLGSYRGCCQPY